MDTKGLQKEFISWCKSKNKQPKSEDETKQLFVAFMKEKHPEEYKQAVQNQQKQQQAQAKKAAHGTKLNYFKSLKNQCTEDEEVVYFKKGGSVKCGCKKKEDGGEINKAEDGWKAKFKKRLEEQKRELEARKNVPNHAPGGSNKSNRFAAAQHFKDLKHKNNYKNNPEEKEPPTINKGYLKNKKGGEINKDCGGSAIKKFKMHRLGGSLNGIPFMQAGTPKAGIRYKGGKKDSFKNENHENVDVIMGQKPNFYTHAPMISRIISSDGNDTTFVEIPEHTSFTTINPRIAKNNWTEDLNNKKIYSNSPEYYTMRRRFSEASLASPGKFKFFIPKPYTPLKYIFGN